MDKNPYITRDCIVINPVRLVKPLRLPLWGRLNISWLVRSACLGFCHQAMLEASSFFFAWFLICRSMNALRIAHTTFPAQQARSNLSEIKPQNTLRNLTKAFVSSPVIGLRALWTKISTEKNLISELRANRLQNQLDWSYSFCKSMTTWSSLTQFCYTDPTNQYENGLHSSYAHSSRLQC